MYLSVTSVPLLVLILLNMTSSFVEYTSPKSPSPLKNVHRVWTVLYPGHRVKLPTIHPPPHQPGNCLGDHIIALFPRHGVGAKHGVSVIKEKGERGKLVPPIVVVVVVLMLFCCCSIGGCCFHNH